MNIIIVNMKWAKNRRPIFLRFLLLLLLLLLFRYSQCCQAPVKHSIIIEMIVNYRTGKVTNLKEVFPYTNWAHSCISICLSLAFFARIHLYVCEYVMRFYLFLCVIDSAYWLLSEWFENEHCFHCPWKWLKTRVHATISIRSSKYTHLCDRLWNNS